MRIDVVERDPNKLKRIPNVPKNKDIEITVEDSFSFFCIIGRDTTNCTVRVSYKPNEWLLELISFRDYLKTIKKGILETVCYTIAEDLLNVLNCSEIVVEVTGVTQTHGKTTVKVRLVQNS